MIIFLPNLVLSESVPVDIWGQRRQCYLRTQREPIYTVLFLSGKLDHHLSEIGAQAEGMLFQLVEQLAKQEDISDRLKAENQIGGFST